ncbi:hypothetical protein MHYP_G00111360 [Metynnis hypsauchen]
MLSLNQNQMADSSSVVHLPYTSLEIEVTDCVNVQNVMNIDFTVEPTVTGRLSDSPGLLTSAPLMAPSDSQQGLRTMHNAWASSLSQRLRAQCSLILGMEPDRRPCSMAPPRDVLVSAEFGR